MDTDADFSVDSPALKFMLACKENRIVDIMESYMSSRPTPITRFSAARIAHLGSSDSLSKFVYSFISIWGILLLGERGNHATTLTDANW